MIDRIKENILTGDYKNIKNLIIKSLEENIPAKDIFEIMNSAINIVGEKYGSGELFLPELMASAKSMKDGMEILKPEILKQKIYIKKSGKVLIGTNKGDIHDIGKALVMLLLENAGFEVIDLGIDVSADRFIEEIRKQSPDILGMSALLTSTMMDQEVVIKRLELQKLRNKIKVIIGGAPITQEWANKIGADAYGADANQAVVIVKKFMDVND